MTGPGAAGSGCATSATPTTGREPTSASTPPFATQACRGPSASASPTASGSRSGPAMRLTAPRLPPIADDALTPEQTTALEGLAEPWRGLNLFRTAVRSPGGLASLLPAGDYIRSGSTLP